ncbi:PD-(D/E)XK nuclease family protein [Nocardia sp. CA2R105]|uniref:RecB family exonuclease n=1 Tax=Nocardia coffeae TaxID=2873381 RepID=UPI001CA75246|nr:PD-(D/E)XK nuclease family protein [Nocardia coffeae]MBY8860484.1 PD-(D/E)XK nuclease family protein [Nocardia coffeae]
MSAPPTITPPPEPAHAYTPALSPSRAMDFKQCPLKYRLRAVDRIPEPPARPAVRGTVVHAVLESLYGLPSGERIPDRAATLVAPAWQRLLAERPELAEVVEEGGLDGFLDEVHRLVQTYYNLEDPTAFDPESCESLIEVSLPDGSPLRGFVDRIDVAPGGRLTVVDYKTGRSPAPGSENRALFQLKFYALIMLRTRGVAPTRLRLIYLSDGQILTYHPDEEELLRFERILSALWTAISTALRTGDFPPNRSRLCQYCDYQALCPAFGGTPPPYPGPPPTVADPR